MKILPFAAQQLRNRGLSLSKKSILINKPWALVDEEMEVQKLIFKKDGNLILSKNGKVEEGKWEYYPEAKSILIDRVTDKILCNEIYINEDIMILKVDGTDQRFFVLANENTIPDLDVMAYLREIVFTELDIYIRQLVGVGEVEIYGGLYEGNKVSKEFELLHDGVYEVGNYGMDQCISVVGGVIASVYYLKKYVSPQGVKITVHQCTSEGPQINDKILVERQVPEDGWIALTPKMACTFSNGKIIKIHKKIFGSF